jgi:hypothetical protein
MTLGAKEFGLALVLVIDPHPYFTLLVPVLHTARALLNLEPHQRGVSRLATPPLQLFASIFQRFKQPKTAHPDSLTACGAS